jgi:hypothetical protein
VRGYEVDLGETIQKASVKQTLLLEKNSYVFTVPESSPNP